MTADRSLDPPRTRPPRLCRRRSWRPGRTARTLRALLALPATILCTALAATLPTPSTAAAATLEEVRERGALRCGVAPDLVGFSAADSLDRFRGFDVELCRAVAMAVLGDPDAVQAVPLSDGMRFEALRGGLVDVLPRGIAWTLGRDARVGEFAGVSFHDGLGFMIEARTGARSALQLDGLTLCLVRDDTAERAVRDYFELNAMRFRTVRFGTPRAALDGYRGGACQGLVGMLSALAAQRASFDVPAAHRLLPEMLSREPLGPMVRDGDGRWEDIVRWSLGCMIVAEELGVDSAFAARAATRADDPVRSPAVRRLLGLDPEATASLGIGATWCADIVRQVGNYAEIYARHLGPNTPLGLERGINALWSDGGLIHAPPIR